MARRRRKSRGKKIFLIILVVLIVLVLAIVGVGAKLYLDLSHSIEKTYESVERTQGERTKPVDLDKKESFSVLLMGIDTGDLGRVDQGRSDTMMVATVSPEDKQTTIVSIPRDTYVDIVGRDTKDKINHAYAFGGAAMAMDTVQKYVDIPIDHYVSINMKGLKELVDAVGGIEVNNDLTFSQDGYDFTIGKITLNGDQALSYSRMRYEDPNGDYQSVLNALESNMKTDMSFDEMKKIALDYREAFGTIKQDQLQGEGFMQDNISYQKVSDQELDRVKKELKDQMNLENK